MTATDKPAVLPPEPDVPEQDEERDEHTEEVRHEDFPNPDEFPEGIDE